MSALEGLDLYAYSPYFHCYCEENVYRLIEKLVIDPPKPSEEGAPATKLEAYAAFLTSYNAKPGQETVPGGWQSSVAVVSGPKPTDVVYWDYHCVAVVKETRPAKEGETEPSVRWWVCDFDSKMGRGKFVIPMELFFGFTLSAAGKNAVALIETKVRFIPAIDFLTHFRTDRSQMYLRHVMRDKRYKNIPAAELDRRSNYQEKPPALPRIQGPSPAAALVKGEINLDEAKERLAAIYSGKTTVTNKHENSLPIVLNTQQEEACGMKSDLVGVKGIGQWIKSH